MTEMKSELEQAGQELARANADRAKAMERAKQVALKADAMKVPVTEISKLLGLSRVSIYKVLGRNEPVRLNTTAGTSTNDHREFPAAGETRQEAYDDLYSQLKPGEGILAVEQVDRRS